MSKTKWVCAAWLITCFFYHTSAVLAYKRTVSPQGKELFWKITPITYAIHRDVPSGLDPNQVYDAIRTSYQTWTDQTCTCIRFVDTGITTDTQLGYDQNSAASNKNLVIFQGTRWNYDTRAVAITSNVFNEDTGEVVAYDMELNNVHFVFSLDGLPRNGRATMDLKNTVTHEVGHILGLDHSPERESTMYVSGLPGETKKRDLHSDDINGLCALYPQNACLNNTTVPPSSPKGCGCQSTSSFSPLWLLWILALLALAVRFRFHNAQT